MWRSTLGELRGILFQRFLESKYVRHDINRDPDVFSRQSYARESYSCIQRTDVVRNARLHTPLLVMTLFIRLSCTQLVPCQRHAAFLALAGVVQARYIRRRDNPDGADSEVSVSSTGLTGSSLCTCSDHPHRRKPGSHANPSPQ